jgi:hypothetical protein
MDVRFALHPAALRARGGCFAFVRTFAAKMARLARSPSACAKIYRANELNDKLAGINQTRWHV